MPGHLDIPLEPLTSSLLEAAGYDPQRRIIAIKFLDGHLYQYGDIPLELVTEFYCAPSKGRFYTQRIKGKFPGAKMTGVSVCGDVGRLGERCEECGTDVYHEAPKENA